MRKKVEAEASAEVSTDDDASDSAATRCSQAWAMLIKRVYEVDPLCCPECGGQMKVVSFIEPPQADAIEAILTHCGLQDRAAFCADRPVFCAQIVPTVIRYRQKDGKVCGRSKAAMAALERPHTLN